MHYSEIPEKTRKLFFKGTVIPALPLALNHHRGFDEKRQRALIRYYLDANAGGLAVAVHTTQFEIRLPGIDLFRPVLQLAGEEFDRYENTRGKPLMRIAGVVGKNKQATAEAKLARDLGFHAVLVSVAAFRNAGNKEILEHCSSIAKILPVVGFYLQPAVGGRILDVNFWREFARIDNVIAIKIAPFNRYHTFDVIRGVAESGRAGEIALYTGNDDNILLDLLSEYHIQAGKEIVKKRIVGGLLGHWAVWTKKAVDLLDDLQKGTLNSNISETMVLANQITDCNAAFFDVSNSFKGCISGIQEVLRKQGLLEGNWTLDKNQVLSPSQKNEIERVYKAYPHLNDDVFVAKNLNKWLSS